MKKRKPKVKRYFKISENTMIKINNLSLVYFNKIEKKNALTIEKAILNTANDYKIEYEKVIRNEIELLMFYKKLVGDDLTNPIPSVNKTQELTGIGVVTLQKYRKKLQENKYIETISTSKAVLTNKEIPEINYNLENPIPLKHEEEKKKLEVYGFMLSPEADYCTKEISKKLFGDDDYNFSAICKHCIENEYQKINKE